MNTPDFTRTVRALVAENDRVPRQRGSVDRVSEHAQVPVAPQDGDRFTCPCCGYVAEFVMLGDGQPGEWVDVTPLERPDSVGGE